ncbi:MAG: histidine phosphatase family protein [Sphingomonas sp.]
MKTLTLLRHAKSGWDDPVARDFDRPLNPKGRRAAAMMGRHMRSLGLLFDHVVASPAVRVVETLHHVELGYGGDLAPTFDPRAYLASAATLLDLIHALPDGAERALLSGHNPGLEELVLLLSGEGDPLRNQVEIKFPTASLAELRFGVRRWEDVAPGEGVLARFVRPRDLDPSLGPDAG